MGCKMSLTHHKQIDKIRPHLDVRSEMPFQFCLSHAVYVLHFTLWSNFIDTFLNWMRIYSKQKWRKLMCCCEIWAWEYTQHNFGIKIGLDCVAMKKYMNTKQKFPLLALKKRNLKVQVKNSWPPFFALENVFWSYGK